MGRIDFSMTSTLIAGASVWQRNQLVPGWRQDETHRDGETGSHSVEVIRMLTHSHDLRDDRFAGPLDTEYFRKLLQILRCSFSNRENSVTKPTHA